MKYFSILTIFFNFIGQIAISQDIRGIRDDVGYCWTKTQMEKVIHYLKKNTTEIEGHEYIAAISPHDDYLYAGKIYYPLFKKIKAKEVVIFGVTHGTVRKEIGDPQNVLIFDAFEKWRGLDHAGKENYVHISNLREYIINKLDTSYYRINNKAHELEHSIEGMIPFLQYFNPDVRIVPIMVTAMPFKRADELSSALTRILVRYINENDLKLGSDIFFLISADANHYGRDFNNIPFGENLSAFNMGVNNDLRLLHENLVSEVSTNKIDVFTEEMKSAVWCGKYSIPMGLLTIMKVNQNINNSNLAGELIKYSTTYNEGVLPILDNSMGITAPFSLKHWVGFFSAGYYIK